MAHRAPFKYRDRPANSSLSFPWEDRLNRSPLPFFPFSPSLFSRFVSFLRVDSRCIKSASNSTDGRHPSVHEAAADRIYKPNTKLHYTRTKPRIFGSVPIGSRTLPRENGNEMELTIRGGNEILRKVSFSPFFSLCCIVSLTSFRFIITGIDHDARVEKLRLLSQDSFLSSCLEFFGL